MKKKFVKFSIFTLIFLVFIFFLFKVFKKEIANEVKLETTNDLSYNSNIIKDVQYRSKDVKGNEYIINASTGEIDLNDSNVIFLFDVTAIIELANSNNVRITSDYGKYNTYNFDTIFSKNVVVKYLENKINSDYLDFSLERNSMIITKNVVYTNNENILYSDVLEMDIETKDTKIFMHEEDKKVNIKSKE